MTSNTSNDDYHTFLTRTPQWFKKCQSKQNYLKSVNIRVFHRNSVARNCAQLFLNCSEEFTVKSNCVGNLVNIYFKYIILNFFFESTQIFSPIPKYLYTLHKNTKINQNVDDKISGFCSSLNQEDIKDWS